jgi:YgiT-type zinc finger domain-containing protein
MLTKCLLCDGKLEHTKEDITEKVLGYVFEFKNVPVSKCAKCGEIHFSGPVNDFMEQYISKKIKQEEKAIFDFHGVEKPENAVVDQSVDK